MSYTAKVQEQYLSSENDNGYEEMVDFYLKIGEEIPSFGKKQSSLVFRKLIETTRNKISIVLGSFSGEISDNEKYVNAILDCLNRGAKITVLFIDPPNTSASVYDLLRNKIGSTVKMYVCNDKTRAFLKQKFSKYPDICHFAIFDDRFYRKEIDTVNFISVANTNDENETKNLINIFNEAINLADKHII